MTARESRDMMPLESTLKKGLCKAIQRCLPAATVQRHEDKFTGGIPDISVTLRALPSRVMWVEVKRGDGKLTALQHRQLTRLGGLLVWYKPHQTLVKDYGPGGVNWAAYGAPTHLAVATYIHSILTAPDAPKGVVQ